MIQEVKAPTTVETSSDFIIDQILPVREIHTIAGPSGVGKTTWMFQTLSQIVRGDDVLGLSVTPTNFTYVGDRSGDGMRRTLDRVGFVIPEGCVLTDVDTVTAASKQQTQIEAILEGCSTPLVVIESLMMLMPDPKGSNSMNSYQASGKWLRSVLKLLHKYNKTLIVSAHSPKLKPTEIYTDKRQRALGSVSYAALSETMFLIERDQDRNDIRHLHLLPRNYREMTFDFRLDERGRFIAIEADGFDKPAFRDQLILILANYPDGAIIDTGEFVNSVVVAGICARRSAYNFLVEMKDAGALVPISKGKSKLDKAKLLDASNEG